VGAEVGGERNKLCDTITLRPRKACFLAREEEGTDTEVGKRGLSAGQNEGP